MKIMVFSDLHGDSDRYLEEAFDYADYVVFLGDGLMKIRSFEYVYPEKFLFVRGNCDGYDETPLRRVLDFDGVRVMLTHGHEEKVKFGLLNLYAIAKKEEVHVVLFGHTHRPEVTKIGDILLINPGSASSSYGGKATAACLTIDKGNYSAEIIKFD